MKGDTFTANIDGQLMVQARDCSFTSGGIGFRSWVQPVPVLIICALRDRQSLEERRYAMISSINLFHHLPVARLTLITTRNGSRI
ncbi:MAG: hypothetical protein K6356_02650 [Chloroflexus sp.]